MTNLSSSSSVALPVEYNSLVNSCIKLELLSLQMLLTSIFYMRWLWKQTRAAEKKPCRSFHLTWMVSFIVNSGHLCHSVDFWLSKIFQPLNTFPIVQPRRWPFTWPFITKRTLFTLPFLAIFFAKHTKCTILSEADTGRWGCAFVRVHPHDGRGVSCGGPLNGGHRSVEMRLQKQLTGDLLDHELPV